MSGTESGRKVVGIDLGTTYSAIAHFDDHDKVDIIPNSDNERITPSVILFEDDEVIVGKIAKNQAVSNPENVVQFVKRQMGDPDWSMPIQGREYTPEVLSAIILKRIITDAEDSVGEEITDAVITVPAYFNDIERKSTMDAGRIAGVNVLGLINEPTAAVLSYGLDKLGERQRVLVYDLGGGTFDVTIVQIEGTSMKVLATDGERRLGGKDWDDMLLNYVAEAFLEQHDIDPRDDPEAYQDLVNKCEDAKKALSRKPKTKIFAQCSGKSLKIEIGKEQFEELTRPLLDQTETYLQVCLDKAKLTWDEIDALLLVGGSTRMPQVPEMLKRVSGRDPEKGVNPDECVAVGAVYWAAMLLGREKAGLDATMTAETSTAEEKEVAKAARSELDRSVPEEIVGMLEGVVVSNVNSHSLGIVIMTAEGKKKNLVMIPEQTPLPTSETKHFGTYKDDQRSVEIKIVEGESEDPDDCTRIGTAVITALPPDRPKGTLISVTYEYDESGRIHIHARDHESGREVRTEIKRAGDYSDEEVAAHGAAVDTLLAEGTSGFVASAVEADVAASEPVGTGDYSAEVGAPGYDAAYDQGAYDQGAYDQGQYAEAGYDQGAYDQGQYAEGYDTGAYDQGAYEQGQYAEGEYAEGEYAEGYETGAYDQGAYDQGQYAEGQYAEGQYAEGQYAEGEYAEGYDTGAYDQGAYEQGQYAEGEYAEGYDTGAYDQGAYDQGAYDQGQYAEGEYVEGEYAEGYDQGAYDQGAYDQGAYDQGAYDQGAYDQGQYAEGGYEEGYDQGDYAEGYDQPPTGDYSVDAYAEEAYASGDYGTGQFGAEDYGPEGPADGYEGEAYR